MPKPSNTEQERRRTSIRVLFESGGCKNKTEVLRLFNKNNVLSIGLATLNQWIKEDPNDVWTLNSKVGDNRLTNAKEIIKNKKFLKSVAKDGDLITQKAIEDSKKEAIEIINLERERTKMLKEALRGVQAMNNYIFNLLEKGTTTKETEEDVIWEGKKVFDYENQKYLTKKTTITEEHKLNEIAQLGRLQTEHFKGLGFFQVHPTVAIQNNNANSQTIDFNNEEIRSHPIFTNSKKILEEFKANSPRPVEAKDIETKSLAKEEL